MTDPSPDPPPAQDPTTLRIITYVLVCAAAAWFLLRELAPVLRPLLVAVLLAYVLLPYHSRLRTRVSGPVSLVLLAGLAAGTLAVLALTVYASVLGLSEEIPGLQTRAVELSRTGERWVAANA